jgi:hypothetical protein
MVRCHECDPAVEYPAVMIFAHWRDVHGLQFDLYEPTEEEERMIASPSGALMEHALEMNLDRIEQDIPALPFWYRPIARWRIASLRRQTAKLRDAQLANLLGEESHD